MSENTFFNDGVPETIDTMPIRAAAQHEIIPSNSVMLRLEIKGTALQKQFASAEVIENDEVCPELVRTTKNLIDRKFLDPILKLDSRMRSDMYLIGLRPKFLGDGNVIITHRLLGYAIDVIERYKSARQELVENLIERWEEAKLDAATRNPALYREEEYPTPNELRDRFSVTYNIFSVGFPDVLERIEEESLAQIGEKVNAELASVRQETLRSLMETRTRQQNELTEAVNEIKEGLRAGFLELVSNLEGKVKGIGTERKVFKPGFVRSFRIFLETFDAKNLANDEELAGMVQRARQVLNGVTPEQIRNDLDVRVEIERELGSIKDNLNDLMQPLSRKASFV